MKKFIKILLIVVISQAGIYFYVDQVVLVPSAKYSQQSITDGSKLPIDPQKVSTDQKYYAKLQMTGVKFYTIDNTLKKEVPLKAGENVSYFSWVPATDLALIGITSNSAQGTSVTLKPVNLETNSHPIEPKISGLSRGARIEDVAFSSQVNVTYIMVKSKNTTSVYRTDVNNNLRKVISHTLVGRIASLQSEDMLFYDNNQNSVVYALNKSGRKVLSPSIGHYALIGTDKNDNIYIGRLSNAGLVAKILKGSITGNFTEYKVLNYAYPVASVTVNSDGKLRLL